MKITDHVNNHLKIVHSHAVCEVVVILCHLLGQEFQTVDNITALVLLHRLICEPFIDIGVMPGLGLVVTVFPVR